MRNKNPFGELDVFRAMFLFFSFLFFFLAAPKASSFLILNYFSMLPALHPGFSNSPALGSSLITFCFPCLKQSMRPHQWYHTTNCAVPVLLMGCRVIRVVTRCFPTPFPRRERTQPGLVSILKIWSYT